MTTKERLLGLAFASSDLLLELDPAGKIVFALGSGPAAATATDGLGDSCLFERLGKASAGMVRSALSNLVPGARSASLEILFTAGEDRVRRARMRFFILPDLAPNVSASVSWEGPAYRLHDPEARPALTSEAFLDRAREVLSGPRSSEELAIAFVDVVGLSAADEMGEAGQRLNASVEAALQAASVDGNSAGKLGKERYSLLVDPTAGVDLSGQMRTLGLSEGLDLAVRASEVPLDGVSDPKHVMRALRFAVEHCLKNDGADRPEQAFATSLSQTLKDANAFRTMVQNRDFELHYQPIVDLKTGAVHHFEALARFSATSGPAETIRMAEELALIETFDVVVAEKALARLRRPGSGLLKFAINVSGASLADDRYIEALLRMTAAKPDERRRLIIEVTETAALADVEAANRRLGALRHAGMKVCIDDFGSGSASYDYLRGVSVDTVKIDGKFVRGLESDPRGRTLIGHLVELCASLKVDTIAEMIETRPVADTLRDLGVNFGQGWLFGKAEIEPRTHLQAVEPGRRRGAVEAWG
jgi:EAL domain-containing protein (putative c-di-GMP-specific phosphodiesterase class I)